jgi:DNA adenine methylase
MIEHLLNQYPTRQFRRKKSPSATAGPIVQWVGGKRQLLERYNPLFPETINDYYEPFMGGAAVFFSLQKNNKITGQAYLSDLNEELVSTYQTVATHPQEVSSLLNELNEKHSKELYYAIRNIDRVSVGTNRYQKLDDISNLLTPCEAAARFLYLNKTCFNAIYRVNKGGLFNVPVGTSLRKDFSDHGALLATAEVLSGANIQHAPYQAAVQNAREGDLVYLDPPYEPEEGGSNFTSYTATGFSRDNQVELKRACDTLHSRGVNFMLSNSDAPFIVDLYSAYTVHTFQVNRNLNRDKTKRKNSANEILVCNF